MVPTKPNGAPKGFAAQLIAALEEAQAAAAQQKPASQLAEAAWGKLQFDFPVVSHDELAELIQEYASGRRRRINSRFLSTLREGASGPTPATEAAAQGSEEGGSSRGLVPLYQQLYAVAVVQCLCTCLEAPEAVAAEQLADLQPSTPSRPADSQLEQMIAAASGNSGAEAKHVELEHRLSQQEDDDSTEYEPLELAAAPQGAPAPSQTAAGVPISREADVDALPALLAQLAGHLSYHLMADEGAWRELRLMQRLAACLAAARRHPRWLELEDAVQPVLRLAVDRLVAAPIELDGGLPPLLDALGIPGGSRASSGAAATSSQQEAPGAAAAAGAHALMLGVALAAQLTSPAARRWLWQEVQQRLLPLAGGQLERQQVALARQARAAGQAAAGPTPQQLYSVVLPCQLLYFYVLHAPPAALLVAPGGSGGSRLQDALLQGGLLRSLVLLFVQLGAEPGVEPLRCALLLAGAAAQPLVEWAAAVPGFTAATAAPAFQPGGDVQLHGALWRVLLGGGGGSLAALLTDAQPAARVPGVYRVLQLMADMQAVSRRPHPLWDASVEAALRQLAATLRQHYSKPREEAAATGAEGEEAGIGSIGGANKANGSDIDELAAGENAADDDDEGDRKLAVGAAEQAELVAVRRARQLQPACLKLIKDLLQRGGPGAGGKHD